MDKRISDLQAQLDQVREELEKAKKEEEFKTTPDYEKHSDYPMFKEKFDKAQKELHDVMLSFAKDKKLLMATCVTATSTNGVGTGTGTAIINALDCINEDGISAALEPFTNPKRIKIIKEIIEQPLHASEISRRTGLVGGQLYHHLNILLESDLIIKKSDDSFYAKGETQGLLAGIIAALGGTKIARQS